MRNVTMMNDYMEVEHGLDCLLDAYHDEPLQGRFKKVVDQQFPGLTKEVEDLFNGWLPQFKENTYITCISEHNPSEDTHGRLSMWRAYGGRSGIALILNGHVITDGASDVLSAYTSPVGYMTAHEIKQQFETVINNIENSPTFLISLGRERVRNAIFTMLHFAVLSTKHTGFLEEKEWRVIAVPKMYGNGLLNSSIEVINGIPQRVQKIQLQDQPEDGLVGLALPGLLNRIIIGPTEFPKTIREAFISLLSDIGIENPSEKVIVSGIPLRNIA